MSEKTLFIQMTEEVEKLIQEIRDAQLNRAKIMNIPEEYREVIDMVTDKPELFLQAARRAAYNREGRAFEALGHFIMMHLDKTDVDEIPF